MVGSELPECKDQRGRGGYLVKVDSHSEMAGHNHPNTRRESTRSAPGINGWGRGYHNLSAGDKLSSLLFVLMNSEVVSRSTGLDVTKFVDDHTNVPGSYHQIGVVGIFRHYLGSIH